MQIKLQFFGGSQLDSRKQNSRFPEGDLAAIKASSVASDAPSTPKANRAENIESSQQQLAEKIQITGQCGDALSQYSDY